MTLRRWLVANFSTRFSELYHDADRNRLIEENRTKIRAIDGQIHLEPDESEKTKLKVDLYSSIINVYHANAELEHNVNLSVLGLVFSQVPENLPIRLPHEFHQFLSDLYRRSLD